MKRQPIPEQRAERIAAIVAQQPGLDRYALASIAGINVRLACAALLIARAKGLIGCAYLDQRSLGWFPADQLDAAKAAAAKRAREAKRSRERRQRAAAAKPVKAARPAPVDPGDVPMIRRRVDARAPLPFALSAPRSVFELGGAA